MSSDKGRDPSARAGDEGRNAEDALAMVARQPVYDPGMAVSAYELLYRESSSALKSMLTDSRRTTLRVIANAALEIGLDRLAGGLPVHITFPWELLSDSEQLLPVQPDRRRHPGV